MHAVTQAMAFSAAAEAKLAGPRVASSAATVDNLSSTPATTSEKASDSAVMAAVEAKSKALWEWFRHINNPALAPSQVADSSAGDVAGPAPGTSFVPPSADHLVLVEQLLSSLKARQGNPLTPAAKYPLLSAIQPNMFVVKRIESACDAAFEILSDRDWARTAVTSPVCAALVAFAREDYVTAVDLFGTHGQFHALRRLGGTAVQRDVLEQTTVEALLRGGRLTEAQMALCERTTLVPNDAQSWRRLASVYGRNGLPDRAKMAHYTAWQCGIGQGGFGGPT
jgi:hypothetical protein